MRVDDMKKRLIATGLTGIKNKEIIDSVFGQLSDGMWENSPRMETYWRFMDTEMKEDGTLFIKVATESGRYDSYLGKWIDNKMAKATEEKIRTFFADKIKQIIKQDLKDNHNMGLWKRDNEAVTNYMGYTKAITVADGYAAYDILKGRGEKAVA